MPHQHCYCYNQYYCILVHGHSQRGARVPWPPNRQLSGFFMEENWLCWDCSLYQKCSVGFKYAKNALVPWTSLKYRIKT